MTVDYKWMDFKDWIKTVSSGDEISIWTDGGCNPNPGPGGWGAILATKDARCIMMGGASDTTNNRMEVLAALSAMDSLPSGCIVTLHSDSQYTLNGASKWIYGWRRSGWVKRDGSAITNVDLWIEFSKIIARHKLYTVWIKGHNGHDENEICDYMATSCRIVEANKLREKKYANLPHIDTVSRKPTLKRSYHKRFKRSR